MSGIRQSYIICATPRTGSNFLCEVLAATGVAGRPDEYFWNPGYWCERWGVPDSPAYIDRVLREGTTPNGVFGVKIMRGYLDDLLPKLAARAGLIGASPPEILAANFPNLRYLWLSRRDKLRQAISFYRAIQTDIWRSIDVGKTEATEPPFNREAIESLVRLCSDRDREWKDFFDQYEIAPLSLVYEDLAADPCAAAASVLTYLGVEASTEAPLSSWRHQRQADGLTERWVQHYLEPQARQCSNP